MTKKIFIVITMFLTLLLILTIWLMKNIHKEFKDKQNSFSKLEIQAQEIDSLRYIIDNKRRSSRDLSNLQRVGEVTKKIDGNLIKLKYPNLSPREFDKVIMKLYKSSLKIKKLKILQSKHSRIFLYIEVQK